MTFECSSNHINKMSRGRSRSTSALSETPIAKMTTTEESDEAILDDDMLLKELYCDHQTLFMPKKRTASTITREFFQSSLTHKYLKEGDLVLIVIPEEMEVMNTMDISLHGRVGYLHRFSSANSDEVEVRLRRRKTPKRDRNSLGGNINSSFIGGDLFYESNSSRKRKASLHSSTTPPSFSGSVYSNNDHYQRSCRTHLNHDLSEPKTMRERECEELATVPIFCLCLEFSVLHERMQKDGLSLFQRFHGFIDFRGT